MNLTNLDKPDLELLKHIGFYINKKPEKWIPPKTENFPYPIQDWEDKKNYNKNLNSKEWAWEFLRRNKHYQKDYYKFINGFGFSEFEFVYDDNYAVRHVKSDGYNISLEKALLKKYKLFPCRLYNPKEDLPENNFFDANRDIDTLHYNPSPKGDRFSIAPTKPEHIVFRLNANTSISAQADYVTQCLKNIKKHLEIKINNKPSNSALYKYIRALDVVASGDINSIPLDEIVNKIEDKGASSQRPDQYFYTDWLPKGIELSEIGYYYLFDK